MERCDRTDNRMHRRRLEDLRWMLTREYWKKREAREAPETESLEDLVDLPVRSYAREFLLSLDEMEREQLFLIEDALARIGEGNYGACTLCCRDIPASRIRTVPWVRLCVGCQSLQQEGAVPTLTLSEVRAA